MAGETYITVGKLGKPHGIRGAFRFSLHQALKSRKRMPQHFWLQAAGSTLPWFIEKIEWAGDTEGIIYFEGIDAPEKARAYSGRDLFLTEQDALQFLKKKDTGFSYLVGFTALQQSGETIGLVEDISDATGQTLLSVNNEGKEVIIPLVDDFVVGINRKKKEIVFDLPDGLLEL
jgi:16S rRNA processing protein RimM